MRNATKGFLAGAAGVGLLLGGSTFALWSDNDTVDGAKITAGNLAVKVDRAHWRDISDDRTDNSHRIHLRNFKIIPGDEIQGEYKVNVGLTGDNMVAELSLAQKGKTAGGALADGLDITYEVLDKDGNVLVTSGNEGARIALASRDNTNRAATAIVVGPEARGRSADFTVRVTVEFDEDTENQDLVKAHAWLKDADLELEQVRTGEYGFTN